MEQGRANFGFEILDLLTERRLADTDPGGGAYLRLEEANTTPLVNGLRDGQLDIIFLPSEEMEKSDFQLRHVSKEPLLVALSSSHPAAKSLEVDLYQLRNEALILTPRNIGPTHFDTVIFACRQAGFEPLLGQTAPQIGTVINLVAADLGFSLVPASMSQLQVTGVLYRAIKGKAPIARLALAYRRGETSKIVRNFVAQVTA